VVAGGAHKLGAPRPVRDLLLFVPAALGYLAAIVVAVYLTTDSLMTTPFESGALAVGFAALALAAGFAGFVVLFGTAWLAWAVPVALVSWVAHRGRPRVLRPVVFAPISPSRHRTREHARVAYAWLVARRWRVVSSAFAALLAVEVIAQLVAPSPRGGRTWADALSLIAEGVLFQAVAFTLLGVAIGLAVRGLVAVVDGLERLAADRVLFSDGPGTARMCEHRDAVRGQVEGGSCIAPVSGRRCAAFRVTGRAGVVLLDDAEMDALVIRVGSERVGVRAESFVAALPAPTDLVRTLDAAQRERVERFLAARDIPVTADLELGETLLVEDDEVVVRGAAGTESVAGDDYRGVTTRRRLDDSDGRPLLIARVPSTPTRAA